MQFPLGRVVLPFDGGNLGQIMYKTKITGKEVETMLEDKGWPCKVWETREEDRKKKKKE